MGSLSDFDFLTVSHTYRILGLLRIDFGSTTFLKLDLLLRRDIGK